MAPDSWAIYLSHIKCINQITFDLDVPVTGQLVDLDLSIGVANTNEFTF